MQEILDLDKQKSLLLVIDIQERLSASMAQDELDSALKKTKILIKGCDILGVPIWQSLQYIKGLGNSVAGLFTNDLRVDSGVDLKVDSNANSSDSREIRHIDFEKRAFSVVYEGSPLLAYLEQNPHITQIIIAGMEAHICVLQSARDLLNMGFEVAVASDCVISRETQNKSNALSFIAQCGGGILNSEGILFDLLKSSESPHFKAISALVK